MSFLVLAWRQRCQKIENSTFSSWIVPRDQGFVVGVRPSIETRSTKSKPRFHSCSVAWFMDVKTEVCSDQGARVSVAFPESTSVADHR